MRPVCLFAVGPVVSLRSIREVLGLCILVHLFFEVLWLEFVARVFMPELSRCALFFFESMLFISSRFKIAFFESALVRSETRVSGRKLGSKAIRQVVQLQRKVRPVVHPVRLFGQSVPSPRGESLTHWFSLFELLGVEAVAPLTRKVPKFLLRFDHSSFIFVSPALDLVLGLARPSRSTENKLAHMAGGAVSYCHCAYVFDVHGADHDVVDSRHGSVNHVVLAAGLELHMLEPYWHRLEVDASEVHHGVRVHIVLPVFRLREARRHRRVVTNLLANVAPLGRLQLKGLTQNRVERLCKAIVCAAILRSPERGNVHKAQHGVVALVCFCEQVVVLHNFSDLLDHRDWFVEVDRHAESRQVFANSVFKNLPNTWFVSWIL